MTSALRLPELKIPRDMMGAIYILEPKTGPWSGCNELGWKTQFDPGAVYAASRNEQSILKLSEWGAPAVWTISLGVEWQGLPAPPTGMGFECEARIYFGAGGSTQLVKVDWQVGTVLSVPMNALAIQALYDVSLGGFPTTVPDQIMLSAQIARGPRGGSLPPQKTYYDTVTAPGTSEIIEIPPFARQLDITCSTATNDWLYNPGNHLYFRSGGGAAPGSFVQTVQADRIIEFSKNGGIPIPGWAKYVYYTNVTASALGLNFIFKLGL